jgi:NACalpha-BTF3-like transcription factor
LFFFSPTSFSSPCFFASPCRQVDPTRHTDIFLRAEESGEKKAAATGGAVEDEDVKLVVAQTGCTEEAAKEALKAENGDLINASESTRDEELYLDSSSRTVSLPRPDEH